MQAFPSAGTLEDQDLEYLVEVCTPMRALDNSVLFDAGDVPDAFFLVVAGRIRVERMLESGERVALGLLSRGHIVGDMGVLSGEPRSASAVVDEELLALRMDASTYRLLRQEGHPAVLWLLGEINARMSDRVADMYARIAQLRERPELIDQLSAVEPTPIPWYESAARWVREKVWN